jgi:hypothetical protein
MGSGSGEPAVIFQTVINAMNGREKVNLERENPLAIRPYNALYFICINLMIVEI